MNHRSSLTLASWLFVLLMTSGGALAAETDDGEETPPGPVTPAPTGDEPPVDEGPIIEAPAVEKADRFEEAHATSVGGYGELHVGVIDAPGAQRREATVDLHRLVVFIGHTFGTKARFMSEIEVEHALASEGKPGEVGVEQAYIEYDVLDDLLKVRAGVLLVPMGIVNQWHEPPIFNGVERPLLDKVIIPSTWREAAVGVTGTPYEGLTYAAYLMSGLDASGFDTSSGLRGGRQSVAKASARGLAIAGRLEYEPTLGVLVGASGYFGNAGPNADLYDINAAYLEADVPVAGGSVDARGIWRGIEARAVFATFSVGDTITLRNSFDDQGNALGLDVASQIMGGYAEAGYNIFETLGVDQRLVAFVRYERTDPVAELTGRSETPADEARRLSTIVAGLTWRPLSPIAIKVDYISSQPDGDTNATQALNFGLGFMF